MQGWQGTMCSGCVAEGELHWMFSHSHYWPSEQQPDTASIYSQCLLLRKLNMAYSIKERCLKKFSLWSQRIYWGMDLALKSNTLITATYNKTFEALSTLLVIKYKLTHPDMEISDQRVTGSLWVLCSISTRAQSHLTNWVTQVPWLRGFRWQNHHIDLYWPQCSIIKIWC